MGSEERDRGLPRRLLPDLEIQAKAWGHLSRTLTRALHLLVMESAPVSTAAEVELKVGRIADPGIGACHNHSSATVAFKHLVH